MKSIIRNLTPRGEAVLVILICFGLGIAVLGMAGFIMRKAPLHGQFSNAGQVAVIVYELLAIALLFLCIGRIRGWSVASFGFQISWKWTGLGVLLFVAVELAAMIVMTVVMIIASRLGHPLPVPNAAAWRAGPMSAPIIILVSIVNGTFEELMEVGYVFKATEKYGMWAAVIISVLIRTALHIPFGVVAMGSVAVIGGIFGLVYRKWRQLWPLIVAHILADLFALLMIALRAT